jgi:predicted DNA-binding transcriptional regulator AlpA
MKLLTRKEVLERLRISDTTLRMRIDWGLFPEPFTITGSRPHLWFESEIDEYLKACVNIESRLSNNDYLKRAEMIGRIAGSIEKNRLTCIK